MLYRILLLAASLLLAYPVPGQEWRKALPGYEFQFPRDHGSHPEFQTEWWYFTGNLATAEGRPFGFKLTIFRSGVSPPGASVDERSALEADQIFLGHFAISDISTEGHQTWEVIGRESFGQAAASTEKLDVRLRDWSITMDEAGIIRLKNKADHAGVDLEFTAERPYVIHGRDGAHQKSAGEGQASHYISYTRLTTTGTLRWKDVVYTVTGHSWMDHEFGSSQLSADEVGWDWFAIQLDSGEDLMLYQLRRKDGTANEYSVGSIVRPDGSHETIPQSDYTITATGEWKSPHSGSVYPMGWKISVPKQNGELVITPVFADQEMQTGRYAGTIYWEGAIRVGGTWNGAPTSGKGYVELVGYAGDFTLMR